MERKRSGKWTWWGGLAGIVLAFGSKLKVILPMLKLGKFGGTIWSMMLMIGTYALIAPWTFAVGIVMMIFIHEMGHILAAKRLGIPVTAPTFIPFVGALISMKKHPQNAQGEAYLAMGGPVVGTIGALACYGLARLTGYDPLYAIAAIGFFLNLINLLPIHPLDGGRIVTAISRWLWLVGLIGGLVIIIFYLRSFLFLFIWALFAWDLFSTFILKRKKDGQNVVPYRATLDNIPISRFTDGDIPVPGERHMRALPFHQYCDLADNKHYLDIAYPGVGSIGRLPLDDESIEKVELIATERVDDETVRMALAIYSRDRQEGYTARYREDYYEVPLKTRLLYSIGYFGLAAFLILMLIAIYRGEAVPPVITLSLNLP